MGNFFSSKTPTNSIPVNKGALFSGLAAPKIAGTPAAPLAPVAPAKAPAPAAVVTPKVGGRRRRSTRVNRKNRKQRTGKNRQRR